MRITPIFYKKQSCRALHSLAKEEKPNCFEEVKVSALGYGKACNEYSHERELNLNKPGVQPKVQLLLLHMFKCEPDALQDFIVKISFAEFSISGNTSGK